MKTLYILGVIFLIVFIGLIYYFFQPKAEYFGQNQAALIINFGKAKRAFAGETIEGMTIYDALITSSQTGNFDFDFKDGDLKRIAEFEENEKNWNVYLNGKKVEEPLDKVFIKAGDKIELKFE